MIQRQIKSSRRLVFRHDCPERTLLTAFNPMSPGQKRWQRGQNAAHSSLVSGPNSLASGMPECVHVCQTTMLGMHLTMAAVLIHLRKSSLGYHAYQV